MSTFKGLAALNAKREEVAERQELRMRQGQTGLSSRTMRRRLYTFSTS